MAACPHSDVCTAAIPFKRDCTRRVDFTAAAPAEPRWSSAPPARSPPPRLRRPLFELMLDHAPAPAIGYQLLFDDGRHLYRYPSARRSWIPGDGQPCNRSAFRLYPLRFRSFRAARCTPCSWSRASIACSRPTPLLQGVWFDPVRPCLVEEGF